MRALASPRIEGQVARGLDAVRDAFEENFADRGEMGGACCAWHHGEKILGLWAASATRAPPNPGKRTRWSWFTRPRKVSPP